MSLLAKAKAVTIARGSNKSEANPDIIELAVAFARHEVTIKQCAKVLGKTTGQTYSTLMHALVSAVRTGKIK